MAGVLFISSDFMDSLGHDDLFYVPISHADLPVVGDFFSLFEDSATRDLERFVDCVCVSHDDQIPNVSLAVGWSLVKFALI